MNIKTIVLHHTATEGKGDGSLEWKAISDACVHVRQAKYPNYICDYHFGIGPYGDIFLGQPITDPAWHCGNDDINHESIAVACIGNFELALMSDAQKNRLIKTIQELKLRFVDATVMLHKEIVPTLCPGKNFPTKELLYCLQPVKFFTDVKTTHLFYKAIQYVTSKKLMNGDSERTFRPEESVTRGELAQVLYNWGEKE